MDVISKDEILQAIRADLGAVEFELLDYAIKPASDDCLGFLGDHSRIDANVVSSGNKSSLHYFAKYTPKRVASHRDYTEKTKVFYKEIELYKTLFSDMEGALSPETKRKKWRPDCFYARSWDLLILENVALKNYSMYPERQLMELQYVECCISTLSRMHASSVIFEEKFNEGKAISRSSLKKIEGNGRVVISDLYPNLIFESECVADPNHPGNKFWEAGIRSQAVIIDSLPNYSAVQKDIIKKRFPDIMRQVFDMVKPSNKFKNIILHGDLWSNNVLFRTGEDGKVKDAVIVDFQMTRYAPPATDLLFFIYNVQDEKFRRAHLPHLFDLYYESLRKMVAEEGYVLETLLPRAQFDESCEYYKKYIVITVLLCNLQLGYVPPELMNPVFENPALFDKIMLEDRSQLMLQCYNEDELYRRRMTEAMIEFIEVFEVLK